MNKYKEFYKAFVECDRLNNVVGPSKEEYEAAQIRFVNAESALKKTRKSKSAK